MNNLYMKLDIQRFAVSSWVECSTLSQSVENNSSVVRITFTVKRTSGTTYWGNAKTLTFSCDGQSGSVQFNFPSNVTQKSASYDFTVYHNNDGTKYIQFYASINTGTSAGTLTPSGDATLATIPRSPVYNSISASNITETSVRLTASIDTHGLSINSGGWDISTDGGATWTYYSGGTTDKTIPDLSPNTKYWYRGYCVTAGGSANSAWNTFTTYDYPKANIVNDITLKSNTNFTIGFYNPLQRTFNFQIISTINNTVIYTRNNVNITSASINMNDVLSAFYNTITSAKEGTYYVKTTYSGNTRNSVNKKYIIDADTCKPTMSVVDYKDINATTLALTNNNKKLVVGYSTIQVVIENGNKATPKYGATIVGYKIKNGDYLSPVVPEVSGGNVTLTCPAKSGIIEIYAIDSREQSGIYQIVNTTMVNYTPITKNQTPIVQRCDSHGEPNGVGEYVKITLGGTFWNNNFGSVTNTVKSITYKYADSKTPTSFVTGTTTITKTTSGNNYNVSQLILGDTSAGFNISNSYIINVTANDELSSTTFTMNLSSGTPHLSWAENGLGVKKKFDTTNPAVLQVGGKIDSTGINVNGLSLDKRLENHDTFTIGYGGHSSYPLYYFLGRLPVTGNANGSAFRINGFLGAYGSSQKAIVDIIIGNRDGLNYYGTYIGQSSALTNSQIKIYQESDGRHSIYYVQNAQYTGGACLNLTGTNCDGFYNSSTTPVTPTGTLVKTLDGSVLTKLDNHESYIQLGLSSRYDRTTVSWQDHIINYNKTEISKGDFTRSGNSIVVGAGISQVLAIGVSVDSCNANGNEHDTGFIINGSTHYGHAYSTAKNELQTHTIASIFPVSQGTTIQHYVNTGGTISVTQYESSRLIVIAIA